MGLLKEPTKKDKGVMEYILHTIIREYPDGGRFPVKSWISGKNIVKPKAKKKQVRKTETIKEGNLEW